MNLCVILINLQVSYTFKGSLKNIILLVHINEYYKLIMLMTVIKVKL